MMTERNDGSRYPDSDEQDSVLGDFTDANSAGNECDRTLGDLIVDVLAAQELNCGLTGSHEDWENLEHAMLKRTALELRCLNAAMAAIDNSDAWPADDFSHEHARAMVCGMVRRLDAGAILSERLRNARWGHPSFGGGEAFLERKAEELRTRPKLDGAEHAEGSAEA